MKVILIFALALLQVSASVNSNLVLTTLDDRLSESVRRGVDWLWNRRDNDSGWSIDTHRAILTLQLTGRALDADPSPEVKTSIKQLELQLAVALAKAHHDPLSSGQLALYVNSLLSLCKNPRDFYGLNLVSRLKHYRDNPKGYPFALVAVALCKAGVYLPTNTQHKLIVLANTSHHLEIPDERAMAVMALTCMEATEEFRVLERHQAIRSAVKDFKQSQRPDGSFGNVVSSAIVNQAMFAAKANDANWNRNRSLEFLLSKQNEDGSFGLEIVSYFTLPLLAGKTFAYQRNCSNFLQGIERSYLEDIVNLPGREGQPVVNGTVIVSVSVWVDNQMTDLRNLRVNNGTNLYRVLNSQFTCEWKRTSFGQMLVSLNGLTQDDSTNRYWMFYTIEKNSDGATFEKAMGTGAEDFTFCNETEVLLKLKSFSV